jgi:hypothetical protein
MADRGDQDALPTSPSNRSAFQEQATEELRRAALRYARQRAALVRRSGRRIDNLYVRELVQDALADTWMGTVSWDPARCSLLDHVRGVIRSRSWKDAIGARRSPHFSLDGPKASLALQAEGAQQHATQGNLSPIMIAALTTAVVTDLRRLADGDTAATAILGAWAAGHVERHEVVAHTGLGEKDYKTARARLTYLVMSLPQSLRDAAKSLLRSAS